MSCVDTSVAGARMGAMGESIDVGADAAGSSGSMLTPAAMIPTLVSPPGAGWAFSEGGDVRAVVPDRSSDT